MNKEVNINFCNLFVEFYKLYVTGIMRLNKEQLLTINGLKLSGIVNEMDNNQFDEYCKALFIFSENFPALETTLKNLFSIRDYDAFSKVLFSLQDMLEKIQAAGLSQSCSRLFGELHAQNYKIAEAHLAYFFEEISNLLRALQMVRQKSEKVLSKEQLFAIHGLKLSSINEMNDNQFNEYCRTLFAFTENFPVQETKLKNLFNAKEYDAFSKHLSSVRSMLEEIQAAGLAQSCVRLIEELGTQNYKMAEAHLTYLLVEISELSINIQMTWQKEKTINEAIQRVSSVEMAKAYTENTVQKNILAVDDVSLILNSLRLVLKDTAYKLTGVKSGAEALKFIKDHNPDLFILDIEMPEMNGYELAKKIRNSGQKAPIIFLTGNARQEYVIKAIEAGAIDFIVKPVNKDHMLEKIKKYIG